MLQCSELRIESPVPSPAQEDRLSGDRWITAVRLLREMRATEVQADAISYNSAISACQWLMALALLAEMKEAKRDECWAQQ